MDLKKSIPKQKLTPNDYKKKAFCETETIKTYMSISFNFTNEQLQNL